MPGARGAHHAGPQRRLRTRLRGPEPKLSIPEPAVRLSFEKERANLMQYMLLCCIDEGAWTGLAAAERDQVMKEYDAFVQGIVKSGHYRAGGRLDGVA